MNIWEQRCETIIRLAERPSTVEYARSVYKLIKLNKDIYPTPAQKTLIKRIAGHYERLETEKLLASLGL